ncbi:inositol monophosphatase family protein [Pedobacter sp. KBW06]|uniref:inositol monophosphatase family protein n=1 Tax=Pedobacter sp. KBW06 TaxID=2153359 RepID=UPI00131503F5|nr:inositol monophosphatase family protein [Pedobacter sp. KBW06]
MEKLLKQSSEIIIKIGKELKATQVPSVRADNKEALFGQFNIANNFSGNKIKAELQKIAPEIKWSYAEFDVERQTSGAIKGLYWVCDAIDGAIHFLQDFYPWCITLTLMDDQKPLMALIYDAERDELFSTIKGQGAYFNGRPISVNGKKKLSDAIVSTVHPNNIPEENALVNKTLQSVSQIMPKVFALRLLGPASLQLAYVAAGRIDGFWEYGNDIYDWLAGALLVEEAGGYASITDSGIIASNKALSLELGKLL